MAVIVKRDTEIQINNQEDCINYLSSVYNTPNWDPFTIHTKVRITNRAGLPADVGSYNVGLLSHGKAQLPIVSLLVLTDGGNFTVASVPKSNIALWT